MRKVVLYIAMSLDGYIADESGKVDWLNEQNENPDDPGSYSEFIKGIDTVVMGYKTYAQIVEEFSPEEWVYESLTSYVITHRKLSAQNDIIFTEEAPCRLIESLREKPGKGIWICGGAKIAQELMEHDMIDVYRISVIPIFLGKGVRLFGGLSRRIPLELKKTECYNGIAELVYQRKSKISAL